MKKLQKISLIIFTSLVVLYASFTVAGRILTPKLDKYQAQIEQQISQKLGQQVIIGEMAAVWRGFSPLITVKDIQIIDATEQPILTVAEAQIQVSITSSLIQRQLVPHRMRIEGVDLTIVETEPGQFEFGPFAFDLTDSSTHDNDSKRLLDWLLSQREILLSNININWNDYDGQTIPITNIQARLTNFANWHQLAGQLKVERESDTSLEFIFNTQGYPFSSSSYQTQMYLKTMNVAAAKWLKPYVDLDLVLSGGQVDDLELWLDFDKLRLESATANISAKDLDIVPNEAIDHLNIARLRTQLNWQRKDKHVWSAAANIQELIIRDNELALTAWPTTTVSIEKQHKRRRDDYTIVIPFLNIAELTYVSKYLTLVPEEVQNALHGLNPTGQINHLKIELSSNDNGISDWQAKAQLFNIEVNYWHGIPGVQGIHGDLQMTPQSGHLDLFSQFSRLDFHDLFPAPFYVNQLSASLGWHREDDDWFISASNIELTNANVAVSAKASVNIPGSGESPTLSVLAGFDGTDGREAWRYYPIAIMDDTLVDWLNRAIISGDELSGTFVMRGPLVQFPYSYYDGEFLIQSDVKNMNLEYDVGWPLLEHANGRLIFQRDSMHIALDGGDILGIELDYGVAEIADMTANVPLLTVDAKLAGDFAAGLHFIEQSPLNELFARELENYAITGPMQLRLGLNIPLSENTSLPVLVDGEIALDRDILTLPKLGFGLDDLTGKLYFSERGISANQLTGSLLGEPVSLTLISAKPPLGYNDTRINLNGAVGVSRLAQKFNFPIQEFAAGMLLYEADISVPALQEDKATIVQLDSNLLGFYVVAPQPIGKIANKSLNSRVMVEIQADKPWQVQVNYGERLMLNAVLNQDNGQITLDAVHVQIGPKLKPAKLDQGLLIEGQLAQLSLPQWFGYLKNLARTKPNLVIPYRIVPAEFDISEQFPAVDIVVDDLDLGKMSLIDARVQVQSTATAWQLILNSDKAKGRLVLPKPGFADPIQANFDRLYLPAQLTDGEDGRQLDLHEIPSMDVTINDLRYGNKTFGRFSIDLDHESNGILVKSLTVDASHLQARADGGWIDLDGQQKTLIRGELSSSNPDVLFKQWGLAEQIQAESASSTFDLLWPGAPLDPSIPTVSGDLQFKLEDGRFIDLGGDSTAEIGVGRLLNLFSLDSLARRVQLDFSDLYSEGFYFDSFDMDMYLTDGVAKINTGSVQGPIAKVDISGDVDIAQQNFDVYLAITPYVTSSIPVVAAVAGGAVAGAVIGGVVAGVVAWVANEIITPGVEKLITYTYKVDGDWDDPKIEEVDTQSS